MNTTTKSYHRPTTTVQAMTPSGILLGSMRIGGGDTQRKAR